MSQSKQSWLIRYHYDALDLMTRHTVSDTPARQRFYCKNRLATEIQGASGHSFVQHDDLLLAQQQRQEDGLFTTLLATDLQRSVLHTLKSDREPQPIAYSPYGHRSGDSGLSSLLGFNGERPDPVTGHYLLGNGYRAFNPVLMRFNCPDSLSPFGKGGLNSYAYCLGDPINKTDSNGHASAGLLQIVYAKKIARNLRVNKILPNRHIISRQPHYSLTPGELLKASDEYLQIKHELKLTDKHISSVFNLDLENARVPNLKNISAGRVQDLNLSLDTLPTPLQKYAKTPSLPRNAGDLLETLASKPNSGMTFDYNSLLGGKVGKHSSGRAIDPSISESYLKRIHYSVENIRQDAMDSHAVLLHRVTGRVYHG